MTDNNKDQTDVRFLTKDSHGATDFELTRLKANFSPLLLYRLDCSPTGMATDKIS